MLSDARTFTLYSYNDSFNVTKQLPAPQSALGRKFCNFLSRTTITTINVIFASRRELATWSSFGAII
jgi:hypothetical protein